MSTTSCARPTGVKTTHRGCLEPEANTPSGYEGWRWLQCTDNLDEYRVLLPPKIAKCYAKLLEAEKGLCTCRCCSRSNPNVAAFNHAKERLIKRCCQLGGFRPKPGHRSRSTRSILAPDCFTLRQLERWERDHNTFPFASPSKHRNSFINELTPTTLHHSSHSINTTSRRSCATSTDTSFSSTSVRSNCCTPHGSPRCVYMVFHCPRNGPTGCHESGSQCFVPNAKPKASHPAVDMSPTKVVPVQKSGCQRYSASNIPKSNDKEHLLPNESIDIRKTNVQIICDQKATTEPTLQNTPPALQLPTPEGTVLMTQKPLPPFPLHNEAHSPDKDERKKKVDMDERPQQSFSIAYSSSGTEHAGMANEMRRKEKEFIERGTQTSDVANGELQQSFPSVPSSSRDVLFYPSPAGERAAVESRGGLSVLGVTETITATEQRHGLEHFQRSNKIAEDLEEEIFPNMASTSSKALGKRPEVYPETVQRKDVRFDNQRQSPSPEIQMTDKPIRQGRTPVRRKPVPRIQITLPTPRESSEDEDEKYLKRSRGLLGPRPMVPRFTSV